MSLQAALEVSLEKLRGQKLRPVTVAVVDSGVDAKHQELTGRVVRAVRVESGANGQRIRKNPVSRNNDLYGHGTAVASIVTQIAPNARILDVRVLDDQNICTGETMVAGFQHAIESGARIINMSLAANAKFAGALHELCQTAYRQNQIVIAARRNVPLTDDGFPAEIATCIGVDIGKFPSPLQLLFAEDHVIEFVAHGDQVVVAAAGGGRTTVTGTSFATPAVAGMCALLVGANPDLRPFDVKSLLRAFAANRALLRATKR
ncbi:MAG: S8 family serine peptidase [Verrucomicrobia bacterium]|nr:S8 family serine peptidase [Verrucomicrobiota bacterium]